MIIGYQGEPGAFSEEVAHAYFGAACTRGYATFAALMHALADGDVGYAILPVYNSIAGEVEEATAQLKAYPQFVRIDEIAHCIEQCLIGSPGATLREVRHVISHPIALAQCRKMLSGYSSSPVGDTAGAVREIVERGDPCHAAIGPAGAAQRYGGVVLASSIQDVADNVTRFVILSRFECGKRQVVRGGIVAGMR